MPSGKAARGKPAASASAALAGGSLACQHSLPLRGGGPWAGGGCSAIAEGCSGSRGPGQSLSPWGLRWSGAGDGAGDAVAGDGARSTAAPWGCRGWASPPGPAGACPARLALAVASAPARPPGPPPGSVSHRSRAGPGSAPACGLPGATLRPWPMWLGRGAGDPGLRRSCCACRLGTVPAGRCDPAAGTGEAAGTLP